MHDRARRGRGEYATALPDGIKQTELNFSKDKDKERKA